MDTYDIHAEVYAERKEIYYVKAFISELGMYISGITVRKSVRYTGWWVQMPSFYNGKAYKKYIEFKADSEFRSVLERACKDALHQYGASLNEPSDVVVEPTDEPITLDDIPF